MNNSNVEKQTKPAIRSNKKACNGKFDITSVMAVDSHEDNQYELTIDNVNNNNLEKSLESSIEADDSDTEFSFLSLSQTHSPDSSLLSTSSGSSRRKNNSVSRGISIHEFLVTPEKSDQLSAIDKLLLKNKAALKHQMKQTRASKPLKEAGPKKKESKPRKDKVLGSKIAAKKKPAVAPADENKKPVKPIKTKKTETKTKLDKGNAKCDDTLKENMPKKRGKPPSMPKAEKKKSPKKDSSEAKKKPTDEAKGVLKSKKSSKNERKTDLRSFKPNASHKTRSFTKVKLRNGKSRIIQENKKPTASPTAARKGSKKSIGGVENIAEALINDKSTPSCKRPIKQEPFDDDNAVSRKKRKTTTIEPTVITDNVAEILSQTELVNGDVAATLEHTVVTDIPVNNIKEERVQPIKQEVAHVPENNIEEINVVTKEIVNPESVLYRDTNGETQPSNVSYVLQDLGSYVKEIEKKTSKPDITTPLSPVTSQPPKQEIEIIEDSAESEDEFSLQEAFTEPEDGADEDIRLQLSDEIEPENRNDTDKDSQPQSPVQVEPTVVCDQENQDPNPNTQDQTVVEEQLVASQIAQQQINEQHRNEEKSPVREVSENNIVKESILGALGLEKVNQKAKDKERDNYTGTLKAVIKVDKGCRRMELMQKGSNTNLEGLQNETVLSFYSKIQNNTKSNMASANTNGIDKSSDSVPAITLNGDAYKNKSHDDSLLNSIRLASTSNMETDYDNTADPINNSLTKDKAKAAVSLVVPEKSSSFSIHPNRLCSDVCKYCYGKFGSLDTPCHVAQLKNPERQKKILLCEPNLKMDTCLCDACYRYVDRKANKPPPKRNKNMRRSISINQRTVCVIQNCNQFARHMVKRKWLLRISKKIAKLSFDVNKGGTRMRYGLCSQHYYLVDYYTLCGICKKRLNRNHMYSIRSELNDLNEILKDDGIPLKLLDNMLLCKLCHYYMSLRLKYGDASKMSPGNKKYYKDFRKKILSYYNLPVSDTEDLSGSEGLKVGNGDPPSPESTAVEEVDVVKESNETKRCNGNPPKKNHNVGIEDIANLLKPLEGDGDKNSARIQVKFGNLNIGKLSNLNIGQNTQTEVKHDKSNDKELPLIADFCFETPCSEPKIWEKCVSTIQFDKGTKKLWTDLQKPYGNQSSFIRHLIMLEKYWRSGALVLSENADTGAVKYINSVKNRIESLETSSASDKLPPLKPVTSVTPIQHDNSKPKNSDGSVPVRRTPEPPPLLKIDQMNSMSFNSRKISDSQPPVKMVNASASSYNSDTISLSQYKEMMHPQPRTKQLTQVTNCNGPNLGVSLLKKYSTSEPLPSAQVTSENLQKLGLSMLQKYAAANASFSEMSNDNGHGSGIAEMMRKYALPSTSASTMPSMRPLHISGSHVSKPKIRRKNTQYIANPVPRSEMEENMPKAMRKFSAKANFWPHTEEENSINSSSIIAKLPKALTVTAIDEPIVTRIEEKPRLIPAPFLAGEKPSVTVFREVSK